jgi:hypothetical protein
LPGVAAGAACAVELCDPLCAWVLSKLIGRLLAACYDVRATIFLDDRRKSQRGR